MRLVLTVRDILVGALAGVTREESAHTRTEFSSTISSAVHALIVSRSTLSKLFRSSIIMPLKRFPHKLDYSCDPYLPHLLGKVESDYNVSSCDVAEIRESRPNAEISQYCMFVASARVSTCTRFPPSLAQSQPWSLADSVNGGTYLSTVTINVDFR
ncbi:unnamed protein product [Ectocarpus sp. 13 AM-2016]